MRRVASRGLPGPVCRTLRAAALAAVAAATAGAVGSAPAAGPGRSAPAAAAPSGEAAVIAALGDLGLALLRSPGNTNAVVSPMSVATVLGMIHSGALGPTEHEIEALFGADRSGARHLRRELPALARRLAEEAAAPGQEAPLKSAARIWIDSAVARDVPASYQRRMALRYRADASLLAFADPEAARAKINQWTAERSAGRIGELLPPGSVAKSTRITLTSAVHFRSTWEQPFDAGQTEPRPFATAAGSSVSAPTMTAERSVAQAQVDGVQLYALPFAAGYDLVLAMPAAGGNVQALLDGASGTALARWRAALQPAKCSLALPKFHFAPKAGSIKATLESLGVKTAFGDKADLRPMLGRGAALVHVDDVHHAAGIAIDERGGEAVAATAATVKPKSIAVAAPACAVDRAFAFAVVHRASGAPVFMGRVGDPTRAE